MTDKIKQYEIEKKKKATREKNKNIKALKHEIEHTKAVLLGCQLTLQNTKTLFNAIMKSGECTFSKEMILSFNSQTHKSIKKYEKDIKRLEKKLQELLTN